jgi:DNA topoisomerase-1
LIVEREREIQEFEPSASFKIDASFTTAKDQPFKARLSKPFDTLHDAKAFLELNKNADFSVSALDKKPAKKSPAPPFTTSTLQQEAARKLYFSVSKTMNMAQRLYEAGLITYMRTDSVNLSQDARDAAAKEIISAYGENYSKTRNFKGKSKGAQEAHEAIRPTNFSTHSVNLERDQARLYELIWKRAIASQMSEAQLERTNVKIATSNHDKLFTANGEVIKFDGFLKVYLECTDDENEEEDSGLLPQVSEGQTLDLVEIKATQRFTRPPARFTEASLVKRLEELGIGRPSTYAPTISTVQKRGYVVKDEIDGKSRSYDVLTLKNNEIVNEKLKENYGADKNKLHPSDIGRVVTDFLIEHFSEIMDFGFTASVEKEFDEIAEGMKNWSQMIDDFYQPFSKNVTKTLENAGRATGERALGNDPKTGKPIIARIGRFGPMVQIGEQDDEDKPRFASLTKGQNINNITLEEALDLFKMPRILGVYEDKDVKANIGRFGPYVQHQKMFVSIPKDEDVMTIELDRAIELIEAKKLADANRIIKTFEEDPDTEILNGRWGPYIKSGKKNYKLPKDLEDPSKLSLDEVKHIMENQPVKGKRKAKKSAKK